MIFLNIAFGILIVSAVLQIKKIAQLHEHLEMTSAVLFYYRVRFGTVPLEDIENKVGLNEEQIKIIEDYWINR